MATLTIRNLPDDLHARLKEQAKRHRRSLNQEVIAELSADVGAKGEDERMAAARERWARANAMISEMRANLPRFLSGDEIDAAIREGRK